MKKLTHAHMADVKLLACPTEVPIKYKNMFRCCLVEGKGRGRELIQSQLHGGAPHPLPIGALQRLPSIHSCQVLCGLHKHSATLRYRVCVLSTSPKARTSIGVLVEDSTLSNMRLIMILCMPLCRPLHDGTITSLHHAYTKGMGSHQKVVNIWEPVRARKIGEYGD